MTRTTGRGWSAFSLECQYRRFRRHPPSRAFIQGARSTVVWGWGGMGWRHCELHFCVKVATANAHRGAGHRACCLRREAAGELTTPGIVLQRMRHRGVGERFRGRMGAAADGWAAVSAQSGVLLAGRMGSEWEGWVFLFGSLFFVCGREWRRVELLRVDRRSQWADAVAAYAARAFAPRGEQGAHAVVTMWAGWDIGCAARQSPPWGWEGWHSTSSGDGALAYRPQV